jgi:hypothetical protein
MGVWISCFVYLPTSNLTRGVVPNEERKGARYK